MIRSRRKLALGLVFGVAASLVLYHIIDQHNIVNNSGIQAALSIIGGSFVTILNIAIGGVIATHISNRLSLISNSPSNKNAPNQKQRTSAKGSATADVSQAQNEKEGQKQETKVDVSEGTFESEQSQSNPINSDINQEENYE